jgi:predicted RND superfamily exporter protein
MVFASAVFCQAATLAIIYYSGETLSALLIVLPPLIQVLAVSGGIHLMNYYFEALEHCTPTEAAIEAFHQGWLPCALSSGTTAMGTASLMVSDLTPIRLFGAYGTLGVLITATAVLLLIPCGLMVWPVRRRINARSMPAISPAVRSDDTNNESSRSVSGGKLLNAESPVTEFENASYGHHSRGFWTGYRDFLLRHQFATLCLLFGMMLIAGKGMFDVQTSVRIETLFSGKSRILQDYEWLESKIGPLVPIEVLITLDNSCELNPRARMALIHQIDTQIRTVPEIHETTSALTFFPPMPSMTNLPERTRLAILSRAVEGAMPSFERLACVRRNASQEVWRITAHCSAVAPLNYGDLLHDLDNKARNAILNAEGVTAKGVSVETSGVMPLVHEIQSELLSDLFESLVSAMIVITITMTLAQAGICNGILSMASNIFPIVLMFGAMGWIGQPMDIGSVMTASIALGIAVDDTLHYLTFFRRGLNRGMDRPQAVLFALNHCGSAMIQTSISCSLGLLAFGLSDFMPTSRFAVTMCGLLMLALWGDLMLLPALLLSPFGRTFELKRHGQDETLLNVPGLDAHMVNTTAGKI